ncbi:MAG: hypothetical protein AMXMBFR66_16130 [Pseudomonadota bacterium]|nr:DNA gyrase inhibitor YacG [Rubrivivax sp.]NLZ41132.1 DNA gyrase inhibitor YacG [Comamonadaceae bacterium]
MERAPERVVTCPACRGPALFAPGNRWRPFCSERCRSVDLGAWASERFRVPAESAPDPGEGDGHGADAGAPLRH